MTQWREAECHLVLLTRITEESRLETLVMEHDIQKGAMHMETAIPAQSTFVINEPQLAELIHKETDARAGGADHLGQRFLTDLRNDRLRLTFLPKVGQQQQCSRQPLLAGIEELIHQILLDADGMHQ